MAHDIFNAAMAYVGVTPWHNIGTRLPETCTWGDMKAAVGFPTALEVPVYAHGIPSPVAGYKALKASDDGRIFSIVGADYGVVQADDFADALMTAGKDFGIRWATAGMLGKNGEKFFLSGEIGEPFRVKGDRSEVRQYFTALSGHDGQTKATLINNATRVVCRNTWNAALSERDAWRAGIRHTSNAADRVKAAALSFADLALQMKATRELADALASRPFAHADMVAALDTVLPVPEKGDAARNFDRITADRAKVAELAEVGTGMEGIRGTAWGAFNAFTEWADHFRMQRAQQELDQLQARALNLTIGPAAEMKALALRTIVGIAGV